MTVAAPPVWANFANPLKVIKKAADAVPDFAEPFLGLAEGEARGLRPGYEGQPA